MHWTGKVIKFPSIKILEKKDCWELFIFKTPASLHACQPQRIYIYTYFFDQPCNHARKLVAGCFFSSWPFILDGLAGCYACLQSNVVVRIHEKIPSSSQTHIHTYLLTWPLDKNLTRPGNGRHALYSCFFVDFSEKVFIRARRQAGNQIPFIAFLKDVRNGSIVHFWTHCFVADHSH